MADTTQKDKKFPIRPYNVRLNYEFTHWLRGAFTPKPASYYNNVIKTEGGLDIGFNENLYFLQIDGGYSYANRISNTLLNGFKYQIEGYYWRVGMDYNLMQKQFREEMLFVGFRLGRSQFSHNVEYSAISTSWGFDLNNINKPPFSRSIEESGLSATWIEFVTGLRVNIWKNLFLGYTIRLQSLINSKGGKQLIANDLPGYGSTNKTTRLSFSYHIYYNFKFKKTN